MSEKVINLPCYVGDTVYCLSRLSGDKRFLPFVNKHRITAISINVSKRKMEKIIFYYEGELGTYSIRLEEIGDTVFLTKEEAEKKIKEEENEMDGNTLHDIDYCMPIEPPKEDA